MNNYLRERRKELGYSQKEAADLIGMRPCVLSNWEKGIVGSIAPKSFQYVVALANLYKTDTNTIRNSVENNYIHRDEIENDKKGSKKKNTNSNIIKTNEQKKPIKKVYIVTNNEEYIGTVKMNDEQMSAVTWVLERIYWDTLKFEEFNIEEIEEV